MALLIQQLFVPTALTTSAATLFTCPANPTTSILPNGRMRFTNTDSAAHAVTAYAIPSGGTAGAGNEFLPAVSVAPNSFIDVDIPMLKAGDFLQAKADTGADVTVFAMSGTIFS